MDKSNPYVFLLVRGVTVGTAKIFPVRDKIHGHLLKQYCKRSENLIAIYNVQIYDEFESIRYPYCFGGPRTPPGTLGELNKLDKSFKNLVAWDQHRLEPDSKGCDLGDHPRVVHAPERLVYRSAEIRENPVNCIAVNKKRKASFEIEERSPQKARVSWRVPLSGKIISESMGYHTGMLSNHNLGLQTKSSLPIEQNAREVLYPSSIGREEEDSESSSPVELDLSNRSRLMFDTASSETEEVSGLRVQSVPTNTLRPPDSNSGAVLTSSALQDVHAAHETVISREADAAKRLNQNAMQSSQSASATAVLEHAHFSTVARNSGGHSYATPQELLTPAQKLYRRMEAAGRSPRESTPSPEQTSSESSKEDTRKDPNWYASSRGRWDGSSNRRWRGAARKGSSNVSRRLFKRNRAVESGAQYRPVRSEAPREERASDPTEEIVDALQEDSEDVGAFEGGAAADSTCSRLNGSGFESDVLEEHNQTILLTGQELHEVSAVAAADEVPSAVGNVDGMGPMMRSFLPKKRKYMFKRRHPAFVNKSQSSLRVRRLAASKRPDNIFLVARKCCRLKCFHNVDAEYAMGQYRRMMRMFREDKKRTLLQWFDDKEGKFRFNGRIVCSTFLRTGFELSTTLQSSVKGTELARAPPTALALPREVRRDKMRDRIVLYLRNRAETTGDMMPHRQHINLPAMTKFEVWRNFCQHFIKNDAMGKERCPPSLNYFYRVWKKEASHIKTRKRHGFTTCTTCEDILSEMRENHDNETALGTLRDARMDHLGTMEEERRGYAFRRDLAARYPRKYCSIILDGADQKSYGLPHFEYKTKSDKGHKIKVKCIGALEHTKQKSLTLYMMTEEFESGANHVLEAAHRVLNTKKSESGTLPETLFIQADNCTRENKNRYFMSYFQMLVARGVFLEVQVSFLPIGHTHEDIDQAFSSVANRLNDNKAPTMSDLLHQLRQCYQPRAKAAELLRVANLSGLFEKVKCVYNVHGFSEYRYFRFTRAQGVTRGFYQTSCDVKTRHCDEWLPFPAKGGNGFLRFAPNLAETPPILTRVPNNVIQVNKCLDAAESRVKNPEKMEELRGLRDRIYTQRSDAFHWDLATTFEMNGDYLVIGEDGPVEESGIEIESSDDDDDRRDIGIAANKFVATKTVTDPRTRFWIAKVIEVTKFDSYDRPKEIKVRWYTAKGSGDPYFAVYEPASTLIDGHLRAFLANVKVSTVICRFNQLSSKRRLRKDAKTEIRAALGEQ